MRCSWLLLIAGAYALTRSLEHCSTRWLVFAFSFIGFGFLAKMLQALIVLPVFALALLVCGATSPRAPDLPAVPRRHRDGGVCRLVDRDSAVDARFEPSVHRRLARTTAFGT